VELSEKEQRELARLESALRAEAPRLDRKLRAMRADGEAVPIATALGILVAVGTGLALVIVGDHYGSPLWTAIGVALALLVPSAAIVWCLKQYDCTYCGRTSAVPTGLCPHCAQPPS
jgi:Flp pilus assembly protein TadB